MKKIIAVLAALASFAFAAPAVASQPVCVSGEASKAVISTLLTGQCKTGYTKDYVESAEERSILEHLRYYTTEGIDKKPTIVVEGANVQIATLVGVAESGESNLVIGSTGTATVEGRESLILGSGNLIGNVPNAFVSTGNKVSTAHGIAIGGAGGGEANGESSVVIGGSGGKAFGLGSGVFGGLSKTASGSFEAVL